VKHEVRVCKELMQSMGFVAGLTRFGLHSHGQYFDWKLSVQYDTAPDLERIAAYDGTVYKYGGVIPDVLLEVAYPLGNFFLVALNIARYGGGEVGGGSHE
jgi:hypothetical protein